MRRTALALSLTLTLLLALATPSLAAQAHPSSTAASLWGEAWAWLTSFFMIGPDADRGCGIDPDGHCFSAPARVRSSAPIPTGDAGCEIDPNGRCRTTTLPGSSPSVVPTSL